MLWERSHQFRFLAQFEVRKVEPRGHRAPHEGIFTRAGHFRGEPAPRLHDRVERRAAFWILPERMRHARTVFADLVDQKRVTEIEVPTFIGRDAMKGRIFARSQQKIDVRRRAPVAGECRGQALAAQRERSLVRLAKRASLGVRRKLQMLNPVFRGVVHAGVTFRTSVCSILARMTTLDVDNPYTLESACTVPLADEKRVSETLDRARAAARAWKDSSLAERLQLSERAVAAMEGAADSIAGDITRMMGKPLGQAKGELRGMAERARYMAEIAEASLSDVVLPPKTGFERRIVKEPLGVVLDLPAWNYPLLTAVNVIFPAVLAGNAVIVKHSPRTPLSGQHFARAFAEAGAPPHLVQALDCDHATSERIVGDARVDHVVFTGSIHGGHRIAQAAAGKFMHVGFELGGNDPAYVAPDCDFEKAVESIVDGAIYNAGQSCCAVERVYVHRSVYARFVEACDALVNSYVLGDPMAANTTLGPIAQPNHAAELEALVADARAEGARVVRGGRAIQVDGKGRFFQATLVVDVHRTAKLMKGESFGPILPLAPVDSDEEALAHMNDSELGLTASIWTGDRDRAARLSRRLDYGTVYMNRCDALDPALPWTGVKQSGRGHSLSAFGFDQLTRPKSIHFRLQF